MKICTYCGRDIDTERAACRECGIWLNATEPPSGHRFRLASGAVALFALLLIYCSPRSGPTADGRPLRLFVEGLMRPPFTVVSQNVVYVVGRAQLVAFKQEFREMGVEAVPFLLQLVRNQESSGNRIYDRSWKRLPKALQALLSEPKNISPDRMAEILSFLGEPAVPRLRVALHDRCPAVQEVAATALERMPREVADRKRGNVKEESAPEAWLRPQKDAALPPNTRCFD